MKDYYMSNQDPPNPPQWTFDAYLTDQRIPEFDFEEWLANALFEIWLKSSQDKPTKEVPNAK